MTAEDRLASNAAVTEDYWGFVPTDGALRMLVLLFFHGLGCPPVKLAYLFILYEVAVTFTDLIAGWNAARFGFLSTLYAGLGLKTAALNALIQLDPT